MYKSLIILGRQADISIAELESLYKSENISLFGKSSVILNLDPKLIDFKRIGGSLRLCQIISTINFKDWQDLSAKIINYLPDVLEKLPDGKIKFGLSIYGTMTNPKKINATALSIKKIIKNKGRSIRIVPNAENNLNSAQVLNNKLTKDLGFELVVATQDNQAILAKTIAVQDIDAYASRDQNRPARDARVGMLPPKLAQTIINLANPQNNQTLLDPFCGTGVLLQEALLMGCNVYGTDIEQKMIDYTKKNLDWLIEKPQFDLENKTYLLEVADACNFQWQNFNSLACETYLGRPFSTEPRPDKLIEVIRAVDVIHKKFLKNLSKQINPGFRLCIAVPAWFTKNGIKHLPVLDQLAQLGYTRTSFVHAKNNQLIYHRDNQIVGRELIVLTKD